MKAQKWMVLGAGCLSICMLAGCSYLDPILSAFEKDPNEIRTYEYWCDYLCMVGVDKFCAYDGKMIEDFNISDGISGDDNVEVSLVQDNKEIDLTYNTGVTDGKSESLHIHMEDGSVKFSYHYETGFKDPNLSIEEGREYKDGEYPMFTYDAEYTCAPEQLSDAVSSKRLFADSTDFVISVRPEYNCEPVYTYTKNANGKYKVTVTGMTDEPLDTDSFFDFEEIKNIDLGLTEDELIQSYEEHFDQFYNSIDNVLSENFYSPFAKLGMKIG